MRVSYIMPETDCLPVGMYEFVKTVDLEKDEEYTVNIYTSGRYLLTINGEYISEGPCKNHQFVRYYDTVKTMALKKGRNEIKITVMHINDGFRYTTVFQRPYPEAVLEAKSQSNVIVTDTSWVCRRNNQYVLNFDGGRYIPPYERVDSSKGYDEYPVCTNRMFYIDFDKGVETTYGHPTGEILEPRPIPMIFPDEDIKFTVVKSGDNFVELDAGIYTTARVSFDFSKSADIKITYAECYTFPEGKAMRDDTSGEIKGYFDTIKTNGKTTYSPFWWRAFRFIRIEAENIKDVFCGAKARFWHYPVDIVGAFECSDPYLNKMQDISINTMLCCTHDTFYDCPYYEQQQYVMDSAIESSVLMRMSHDKRIIRKTIDEFAASQESTGLILANYPSTNRQVIPGFSLFWIFMLYDYLMYSKDTGYVKSHVSTMDKVLSYFDRNLSPDGLILKTIYWDFVDWVPEWGDMGVPHIKDGEPITIFNLYYAYALLCGEEICKKVGRPALAEEYRERYNVLSDAIKNNCYDAEKGLYTDSGKGSAYSAHTIIWAILAELEIDDAARALASRLNEEGISQPSFSFNYYTFRALEKCGMADEIFNKLDGWRKMIDLHCTTWCENPDSPRSECHGWSSAPLYELSANILGVKVGYEDEITISPITAGLSYAKGIVPTRFGNVEISWTNTDGDFKIRINSPEGIRKHIILPDGRSTVVTAEEISL